MNKITLFLMSEKGFSVLKEIISVFSSEIIDFIVVAADKNVANDFSADILDLAKENKIRAFDRNDAFQISTPIALAISWRWLIPVNEAQTKLIVFHDSLLPKYRGFAPLVNQLIQKEPEIGVTAFLADEKFDEGPIVEQEKISISYPIKIEEAISKVLPLYCKMAVNIVKSVLDNRELNTTAQNEDEATYSLWRDEKDYEINWNLEAEYIKRFINAVGFPYLGASTKIGDRIIRILEAEVEQDLAIVNRDPGKTLFTKENYTVVVCGRGLLKITEALYDDTKDSIFPLQKYRLRFS